MADIFTKEDTQKLLRGKTIWFFGDSNMRGMYKDLIWLLEQNTLINLGSLRGKLEATFMTDLLIKGGALHRGRNFEEIRLYKNFKLEITIEYIFLTQCLCKVVQDKLKDIQNGKLEPDVIIMNSCLWDITRWGSDSVELYKKNILNLLQLLQCSLPPKTKFIWTTTPPISNEPKGGFFIKQIEFLKHTLRFDVMEANQYVSKAVISHGFDVLDIHYHLLLQIHRRRPDGIHWNPESVRHITNLILTHLCLSWELPLPGNFKTPLLKTAPSVINKNLSTVPEEQGKDRAIRSAPKPKTKKRKRGPEKDFNSNLTGEKRHFDNFGPFIQNKRLKAGYR